ncbi:MAG: tetratricopeptide repeat protein [Opitutaceae bacterium]
MKTVLVNAGRDRSVDGPWSALAAIAGIIAAVAGGYLNSFHGPFILDDKLAILANPSVADWHVGALFRPPEGTTAGRPLLNLTFAANWMLGGSNPWGYHLVNTLIHLLAAITLFGAMRRALALPTIRERFGNWAIPLSGLISVLWAVHPLQTAAVTYVSQRAECLMGLFYLFTLYAFFRAATASRHHAGWYAASVIACFCGMAVKEVMVTAPVLVLLFDSCLITHSPWAALRKRRWYYAGLVGSWIFLASLMINARVGDQGIGFNAGVPWWLYALTEAKVVLKYLGLFFFPHPLVFDYGREFFVSDWREVLPAIMVLAVIFAAIIALWRRSKPAGAVAGACFILLAPTSSFVPIALQPMAESRMYLPSAALTVLVALSAFDRFGRKTLMGSLLVAAGFIALTAQRNADYRNELRLWKDTLAKQPVNSRALTHLGAALARDGDSVAAIASYEAALRIDPGQVEATTNLGFEFLKAPELLEKAIGCFRHALQLNPKFASAHHGLANALSKLADGSPDAMFHYVEALRLNPYSAAAHDHFGVLLSTVPGRSLEAVEHFNRALQLDADYFGAHYNLANEKTKIPGAEGEAASHYRSALRLKPDFVAGHVSYGMLLSGLPGKSAEAMQEYRAAISIDPNCFPAHNNLANELSRIPGREVEAIAEYRETLRLNPDLPDAHYLLAAKLVAATGDLSGAIEHYLAAIRLRPDFALAHYNLAVAYARRGQEQEAARYFESALRLDPALDAARSNLERLRSARK